MNSRRSLRAPGRSAAIPDVMTMSEVGEIIGWPRWRVSRWLKSLGACEKRNGKLITTYEMLIEHFPEVGRICRERADELCATRVVSSPSIEGRMSLILAKQESNDARVRSLEGDIRALRREIRKLKRAMGYRRSLATPTENVSALPGTELQK